MSALDDSNAPAASVPAAAASVADVVRLPVSVPRTHANDGPVAPDELAGPRPAAPMGFSVPVHIIVPRAGIDADVSPVGLAGRTASGEPALRHPRLAAWYDLGPAPGQLGVAVLDAHVDARASRDVRRGDTVEVARADHSLAIFTVDKTERIPSRAAIQSSYSGAGPYPALNLVTCAGSLDAGRHGCRDHTVVHAHLTSGRFAADAGQGR
jgi:hypothetical protein